MISEETTKMTTETVDKNFDKVDRTLDALFRKGRVKEEYRGEVAYYKVKP